MNKEEEFLLKWFHGKYGKNVRYIEREWTIDEIIEVMQEYAEQEMRELREPIENALYATGRFTTDECTQLAEGIIQYIAESKQEEHQ